MTKGGVDVKYLKALSPITLNSKQVKLIGSSSYLLVL